MKETWGHNSVHDSIYLTFYLPTYLPVNLSQFLTLDCLLMNLHKKEKVKSLKGQEREILRPNYYTFALNVHILRDQTIMY